MNRSTKIAVAVGLWAVATYFLLTAKWKEGQPPPSEWARPPAPPADLERFSILTYNVLSHGEGIENDRRTPALIQVLKDSDADVIVLQETTEEFLARLLKEEWIVKEYRGAIVEGRVIGPAGQYLLSKFPIKPAPDTFYEVLPQGRQRRAVLACVLRVGPEGKPFPELLVVNVHLESLPQDGLIRQHQLFHVFGKLVPPMGETAVVGDFNFGDGQEPETTQLDPDFADAWTALKPDVKGFTWDMEKSGLAKKNSLPGDRSARIDRILLRSAAWKPVDVKIVGDGPLDPASGLFPSDHFGVLATFARMTPEEIEKAKAERERKAREMKEKAETQDPPKAGAPPKEPVRPEGGKKPEETVP